MESSNLPVYQKSEIWKAFKDLPELRSKVLGHGEAYDLEKLPGQLGLRDIPELLRLTGE